MFLGFAFLMLVFSASTAGAADRYWIKVSAKAEGAYKVAVQFTTNLPDGAVIALSGYLAGLKNEDTAIGFDADPVKVKGGKASAVIDAAKGAFPSKSWLIRSKYELTASFHPMWKENQALASKLSIKDPVEGISAFDLTGNGKDKKYLASLLKREEKRDWVKLEVYPGYEWDANVFTNKLGAYKTYSPADGNPSIVKLFYFPDVDLTLKVNVAKKQVMTWTEGIPAK